VLAMAVLTQHNVVECCLCGVAWQQLDGRDCGDCVLDWPSAHTLLGSTSHQAVYAQSYCQHTLAGVSGRNLLYSGAMRRPSRLLPTALL
jgi:hypothetical protein